MQSQQTLISFFTSGREGGNQSIRALVALITTKMESQLTPFFFLQPTATAILTPFGSLFEPVRTGTKEKRSTPSWKLLVICEKLPFSTKVSVKN